MKHIPKPEPGYYRHHGGGTYTVMGLAEDSTNARELPDGTQPLMVIYVSHTYGHVCVRDLLEFIELVAWPETELTKAGDMKPRFMRWPEPERSSK